MRMDRTQRGVHGQQGFSFIETLLAVAVIGLGLLAITSLFPTGYSNITYGGRTTSALALAQQKLEQLKAAAESEGFGGINTNPARCPGTPETVADAVVPTVVYTRTCVLNNGVGVGSLAQDLKRVRVRVTWEWGAENRPGSVELEQLFTRTRP